MFIVWFRQKIVLAPPGKDVRHLIMCRCAYHYSSNFSQEILFWGHLFGVKKYFGRGIIVFNRCAGGEKNMASKILHRT